MRESVAALRAAGRKVALIPTSGALHAGHASLIRLARESGAAVVVSAFVNPLQFGPSEDYAKYPRTPEADQMLADKEGVDVLFTPTADEMFPKGFSSSVQEEAVSKPLCGVTRAAHFRGTLTGWLKLINIVQPDTLVLGEKDVQQLAVVKKVAADLLLPLSIITGPVVRDADGMAVSARNAYLTPSQREEALAVIKALRTAKEMVESGVKSTDRVVAEAVPEHVAGPHGDHPDPRWLPSVRGLRMHPARGQRERQQQGEAQRLSDPHARPRAAHAGGVRRRGRRGTRSGPGSVPRRPPAGGRWHW